MEKYDLFKNESVSLINLIYFQFRSWYGRHIQKRNIKINKEKFKEPRLLDLGVGANYRGNWIHADFFRGLRLKFWKKYSKRRKNEFELDLRYPINCEDNIIDGVYSGHALEHLFPLEAYNLIKEILRILKPGCWLRINVPDLGKYIDFYVGNKPDIAFDQYNSGCEAIRALTQDYGHHSVWDEELLVITLETAGFINVKVVKYGEEGTDQRLIKEEPVRRWETLVMEAQKPE